MSGGHGAPVAPGRTQRRPGVQEDAGYCSTVPEAATAHEPRTAGIPPVLRFPALDATGVVDAVVTTRHGGVSGGPYATCNLGLHVGDDPAAVVENRSRAAAAVGLGLDDLVFCRQTHGSHVELVDRSHRGRGTRSDDDALAATDAVVTASPDVGLVVLVADCAPVLLVDPVARVLGAVHAGWRGTVARITGAAVSAMEDLGARPEHIVAAVGPAVTDGRYQVGAEVRAAVERAFGDRADEVAPVDPTAGRERRWRMDLWTANRIALTDAGVDPAAVHVSTVGTDHPDLFSDRAERPCGRFAAIARLLP